MRSRRYAVFLWLILIVGFVAHWAFLDVKFGGRKWVGAEA